MTGKRQFIIFKSFTLTAVICFFVVFHTSSFAQTATPPSTSMGYQNIVEVIINFLAGLVLFLYGITKLSNGVKTLAKDNAKNILAKFTTNRFAGLLTGFVATTILDSSSLVIVMVIALVNAGVLSSSQSIGVVLGANIGTTISSQIIAFDISSYSPIAMFIGFMMYSLSSTRRMKKIGVIVFGAGMIFFGMKIMGYAMSPLKDDPIFVRWMQSVENPLIGVIVGAAFTVVIQSSSATLGVVIAMANQGMISLPAGIALMIGAELGTCSDIMVATIGRSREAVRVGVFHLTFNFISVAIGLLLFKPFTDLVTYLSFSDLLPHQIANAHFLFNLIGAILFIGFTNLISKGLKKVIPEKEHEEKEYFYKGDEMILIEKIKENKLKKPTS
jgi:phosphate:Na+ symporter